MIPFNKPSLIGSEHAHMSAAFETGKLSGNGLYTHQCHHYFEQHFGVLRALLTHSCTGALEMSALLCNIKPGDEVIMPTYTFVSPAQRLVVWKIHHVGLCHGLPEPVARLSKRIAIRSQRSPRFRASSISPVPPYKSGLRLGAKKLM